MRRIRTMFRFLYVKSILFSQLFLSVNQVLILIASCVLTITVTAQQTGRIRVTSDTDTVALGQRIEIQCSIRPAKKTNALQLKFSSWAALQNAAYPTDTSFFNPTTAVEILSTSSWPVGTLETPVVIPADELAKGEEYVQHITATFFDSGIFTIPPPRVMGPDSVMYVRESPVRIVVVSPVDREAVDSTALAPIRDIHREEATLSDYAVYIALAILIVFAIVVFFWWRRRKKKILPSTMATAVVKNPSEVALEALGALEQQQLWQQGKVREFQDRLTDIMRAYIEGQFTIPAPEMTTDEIIQALQGQIQHHLLLVSLREILQVADMVKFARSEPDDSINGVFLQQSVQWVYKTSETNL